MLKLFIIITIILVVIIIASVIFFMTQRTQDTPSQKIDPTLFQNISIINYQPEDGMSNVGLTPEIKITFSRDLTNAEKSSVELIPDPQMVGNVNFPADNIYRFLVSTPLQVNKEYTLVFNYGLNSLNWQFSTPPIEMLTTKDQQILQTQADFNFGQVQEQVLSSYPWINELPIQTIEYYVYFDLEQKKFISYLYPNQTNKTRTQLENEVVNRLSLLGINVSQYQIEYIIN